MRPRASRVPGDDAIGDAELRRVFVARTHARTHAVRRAARTRLSFDACPLSR